MKDLEPLLCSILDCDSIRAVEGQSNDICRLLDMTCGIDYLKVIDKSGDVKGIANRVQWIAENGRVWNSFTVRKDRESGANTEFIKRKTAIENDSIYPYYTIQTYVRKNTDELISLAIAKTTDINDYIEKYNPPVQMSTDERGRAWFYVVYWKPFEEKKYEIIKYFA